MEGTPLVVACPCLVLVVMCWLNNVMITHTAHCDYCLPSLYTVHWSAPAGHTFTLGSALPENQSVLLPGPSLRHIKVDLVVLVTLF